MGSAPTSHFSQALQGCGAKPKTPCGIQSAKGMGKGEKAGLGRALLKHHNHMIEESREKGLLYRKHNKKVLESVTDVSDIDAVIQQADEAHRYFSDNHLPVNLLVNLDSSSTSGEMTVEEQREQQRIEEDLHASSLRVPRRPPWNSQMSVEDLNANEGQAFLVWRRSLARLEKNEKLVLTPFEKNLDIWRQLWRVVERSDLIVMVVDARDPLFYRCPDLEAYVKEVDQHKRTLLLVNKADLLPNSVREKWAEYFRLHGILFLFWSAKAATAALEGKSTSISCDQLESTNPGTRIYGREELLARLQLEAERIVAIRNQSRLSRSASEYSAGYAPSKSVMVGFVGYPNVGKSSTINALVGEKRTGVTSTPGKTKHFQTLIISDKLTLCDCPGLVFPSFTSSRFEMIASGVLPIHRMTEHREPVQVVANRVPRQVIEQVYNISLPKPKSYEVQSRPPLASELLKAYCASRGYVASSGLPDETKAARQILKDYIDGKLPHFELPPEMPLSDEVEDTGTIVADEVEGAGTIVADDVEGTGTSEADEVEDTGTIVADEVEDNGTIVADEVEYTETVLANEVADTRTILYDEDESDSSDAENSPVIERDSGPQLEHVLEELNSFDMANGLSSIQRRAKKTTTAPHKQHKKPQRKKDRTWRVKNNEDDGMPAVRVFQKPLNTGPLRR